MSTPNPVTDRERILIWALYDMVEQHCGMPNEDDKLFSGFISSNADAMRLIGAIGMITITKDAGSRSVEATRMSLESATKALETYMKGLKGNPDANPKA